MASRRRSSETTTKSPFQNMKTNRGPSLSTIIGRYEKERRAYVRYDDDKVYVACACIVSLLVVSCVSKPTRGSRRASRL